MKKLADYGRDDHPADDPERPQVAWAVAARDDCEECGDVRVELTIEEVGRPGTGLVAHLAPGTAKQLAAALARALHDMGDRDMGDRDMGDRDMGDRDMGDRDIGDTDIGVSA